MTLYISNAFSLSMLDREDQNGDHPRRPIALSIDMVEDEIIYAGESVVSAIGHADTAALISGILGMDLPVNRVSIKLKRGDRLLVAQYIGPRLPEGATTLPDGAAIEWWLV